MEWNGTITMSHGSGGRDSAELMQNIFGRHFSNETLDRMEDAAVIHLEEDSAQIVVSTDSFVVTPLVFRGGDIGKLAVCGTVNDILMMGATPCYLTCGFILEEGLPVATLDQIVSSMASTARAAGVSIIAGDTKVVEGRGGQGELYINTTGIGRLRPDNPTTIGAASARVGDAVIVSGNLGDHHACILSARMDIQNDIQSDCAILAEITDSLFINDIEIHVMRDVTRGGLATVLNEIAANSGVEIQIEEKALPVSNAVGGFCGIMGLDPLYMGNEGKMVLFARGEDAPRALAAMRTTAEGRDAAIIGHVAGTDPMGTVVLRTAIGGSRRLDVLYGEGLPRIC
jgi:hydrogenase expression/formation protein HypE